MKRKRTEKMKDNIILIGFMGCGKTTVGNILSKKFSYSHIDTDHEIEREAGCAVKDIFEKKGEEYFRKMETKTIEKLKEKLSKTVVSTGGGLPLNPVNADILKEMGLVVYLKVSPAAVWERLKHDKTRPLLQKPSPKDEIIRLLDYRHPIYEAAAHLVVEADKKGANEIAAGIVAHISQNQGSVLK